MLYYKGPQNKFGHVYPELSQTLAVFNGQIATCTTKDIYIWNTSLDSSLVKTLNVGDLDLFVVLRDNTLAGALSETIKIWNDTTGDVIRILKGHSEPVNFLLVLNEDKLASASYDHTVIVWDLKTGSHLNTLKGHSEMVTSLALLEGNRLASSSRDGIIKIWNLTSFEKIMTFKEADNVNYLLGLSNNR